MGWEVGWIGALAARPSTVVGGHINDAKVGGLEFDPPGYRREISKYRRRLPISPDSLAGAPCLPRLGLAEVVLAGPL